MAAVNVATERHEFVIDPGITAQREELETEIRTLHAATGQTAGKARANPPLPSRPGFPKDAVLPSDWQALPAVAPYRISRHLHQLLVRMASRVGRFLPGAV